MRLLVPACVFLTAATASAWPGPGLRWSLQGFDFCCFDSFLFSKRTCQEPVVPPLIRTRFRYFRLAFVALAAGRREPFLGCVDSFFREQSEAVPPSSWAL